jgi:hypothetical protein
MAESETPIGRLAFPAKVAFCGTPGGERKNAGLPDKSRRDPHKPGESPALQKAEYKKKMAR